MLFRSADLQATALNLEREFTTDLDQLRTLLQAQLGTLAATLGLALSQVTSRVQTLENSPCQQFCGILGELGQLLQGLELAGLIALVAEAYAHPDQVVRTIEQDLVQPVEQGVSSALGLFGVKVA